MQLKVSNSEHDLWSLIIDVDIVLKDELETAMQMIGITSLDQAHPGLVNTAELDRYVYRSEGHPYARKIVRKITRARL